MKEKLVKAYGVTELKHNMAKKDIVNTKARTLIKAYLVMNKGKKCSSAEISDFINSGHFNMIGHYVDKKKVSHMINSGRFVSTNMMYGVQYEKINGLNHYWVE